MKGLRVRQGALFSGIPERAFEKRGTPPTAQSILSLRMRLLKADTALAYPLRAYGHATG